MDREKVIKGLEMCLADEYCDGCPYEENCFDPDIDNPWGSYVMRDALALLKEQEKPNGKCVNECECWDSAYERGKQDALKEQEAVEPYQFEDIWKCGNCGDGVVAYEELGVSGIEEVKFDYCPTCGRRVLWEGR